MASSDSNTDDSLYPIAVLIDELRNEDVQVIIFICLHVLCFIISIRQHLFSCLIYLYQLSGNPLLN